MIFGIIMLLEKVYGGVIAHLSLVQPQVILGLLMGGAADLLVHRRQRAGRRHRCLSRGRVHARNTLNLNKGRGLHRRQAKRSLKSAPSTRRKA